MTMEEERSLPEEGAVDSWNDGGGCEDKGSVARGRLEQLLALEEPWLRRLALQLVGDEHEAADVQQETMLLALRHRPVERDGLRPWLTTVARSVARRRSLRKAMRPQREGLAARKERQGDTTSMAAAHREERSILARSVAELPEPFRTAIRLRFVDELSAREIASRLDLPIETVRTRIKRGLARLQARLDRTFGGRSAWATPLLATLRKPGPRGRWRAPMRPTPLAALAIVLLAAAVSLPPLLMSDAHPASVMAAAGRRGATPVHTHPAARPSAQSAPAQRRQPVEAVVRVPFGKTGFKGRCVDDRTGAPQAGCAVTLTVHGGDGADDEQESAETGADGTFLLLADARPAARYELTCRMPDRVPMRAYWIGRQGGGLAELGDVRFEPGCHIDCAFRWSDGTVAPNTLVELTDDDLRPEPGTLAPIWFVQAPVHEGRLELEHPLAAGAWSLHAVGSFVTGRWQRRASPGAREAVWDIALGARSGARVTGRVVDGHGRPVAKGFVVVEGGPLRIGPDGTFGAPWPPDRATEPLRITFMVDGYEPADDWPVVSPDGPNEFVLLEEPELDVAVTDAVGGDPVEDYGVRVATVGGVRGVGSESDLRFRDHHAGGLLTIPHVRRGQCVIHVEPFDGVHGFGPPVIIDVDGDHLAPVHVAVPRLVTRVVRVLDAKDQPVVGTRVQLVEPLHGARCGADIRLMDLAKRPAPVLWFVPERSHGPVALLLDSSVTGSDGTVALHGYRGGLALILPGPGNVPATLPLVGWDADSRPIPVHVKRGGRLVVRIVPDGVRASLATVPTREPGSLPLGYPRFAETALWAVGDGVLISHARAEQRLGAEGPNGDLLTSRLFIHALDMDQKAVVDDETSSWTFRGVPPDGTSWLLLDFMISRGHGCSYGSWIVGHTPEVGEGQTRTLELDASFLAPGELTGKAAVDGEPIRNATLFLRGLSAEVDARGDPIDLFAECRTDADGHYSVDVPAGAWRAELEVGDIGSEKVVGSQNVAHVVAGATTAADFDARLGTLRLRLVGHDGQPCGGRVVRVTSSRASRFEWSACSDDQGVAEVSSVPFGALEVRVMPEAAAAAAESGEETVHELNFGIDRELLRVTVSR